MSRSSKPIRRSDDRDQLLASFGVIARVALADVVEQRPDHQQVGPGDAIGQHRRLRSCLPQVPVDRETVVGVALRSRANRLPFGEHAAEQLGLVERLEHRDRPRALEQQRDQFLGRARRPWLRPLRGAIVQCLEGAGGDRRLAACGADGELQHQGRVELGRHVDTELHLAVAQRDTRCQRPWLHRLLRRSGDGVPRSVELPRHRSCRRRHRGHQIVGVTEPAGGSDRVLILQSHAPRPRSVRLGGARPGRVATCRMRLRVLPAPRWRCPYPRHRSTASSCMSRSPPRPSLRFGSSEKGDLAIGSVTGEPTFAQQRQPCAGIGAPCLSALPAEPRRRAHDHRRSSGRRASWSRCRVGRHRPTTSGSRHAPNARDGCPCPRSDTTGRRARPRSAWRSCDGRPSRRCRCAAPSRGGPFPRRPAGTPPVDPRTRRCTSPASQWSIASVHASHHARPCSVVSASNRSRSGEYHSGIVA